MTHPANSQEPRPEPPAGERFRLLALDDQRELLAALARLLRVKGFDTTAFTDPHEALDAIRNDPTSFDVAIFDVSMPKMNGLEVLARAKKIAPELPVVMLTADDRAETAVAALREGAFNYLTKPLEDGEEVALTLTRAANHSALYRRARQLEARLEQTQRYETIVGSSRPMRQVFATIDKLAKSDVSVLVRGESGTGKELVARAIHDRSDRADRPFVALNCAALPEALVDSELFGHTKGAFTGAVGERPGAFEQANGGTLFLDEIGDIPLPVQLRLLRVLQEREVRAVGSDVARPVDVRVIAATLVDLDDAVERKTFRADLYYRLNVVTVSLPALRERPDDIPLLITHFARKYAERDGRTPTPVFDDECLELMTTYEWPGNVRELENSVQRALALSADSEIGARALPPKLLGSDERPPARPSKASTGPVEMIDDLSWTDDISFKDARKQATTRFERKYIERLLRITEGNISEAARRAGVDRSNFRRILGRHDIDASNFRD